MTKTTARLKPDPKRPGWLVAYEQGTNWPVFAYHPATGAIERRHRGRVTVASLKEIESGLDKSSG